MNITFQPVTDATIAVVSKLHISPAQAGMVETVEECYAEAKALALWRPTAISMDGEMVGFTMYGLWKDEGESGRVWLDRFFIDERQQGKGYAKQILPVLLERIHSAYGCGELYLSVYPNNSVAIRLYEGLGFRFNGEVDSNGERVMVLVLDQ